MHAHIGIVLFPRFEQAEMQRTFHAMIDEFFRVVVTEFA